MADESDRTIPATPRRREAARQEGLAPSPAPLSWAVATAITILLLPGWIRTTLPLAAAVLRQELLAAPASAGRGPLDIGHWLAGLLPPAAALVFAAGAAGLATHVACAGIAFDPGRLSPRFSRFNPWSRLARILSVRTVAAGGGRALALVTLGTAGWLAARPLGSRIVGAGGDDLSALGVAAWWTLIALAAAAVIVAGIRHGLDRLRFERAIRMTPAELRDELAGMRADPKIRFGGRAFSNRR